MKHEQCPFCGYRELRLSTTMGNRIICKTCFASGPEVHDSSAVGASAAWDKWDYWPDSRLALMGEMADVIDQYYDHCKNNYQICGLNSKAEALLTRYEESKK